MRLAAVLRVVMGILAWLAPCLSLAENSFAYLYYGGRWQSATIPWYYNPAQQPASYTTAQTVAILQASMASWSKGCGIRFSYQGITSIPATQAGRADRVAVLGWDPTTSIPYTNFNYDANGLMTNGRIVFKPDPAPALSDFQANANHELGHLLGLSHSDQPRSIMFSNPYHAFDYQLTPKGDDYAACVAIYGGGSLQDDGDLARAQVQANPDYQVDLYVSTSTPGNTPPTSVSSIPASYMGTTYFSAYYRNVPVGRKLMLRTITPDGYEYEQVPFPNNFTNSYFYMYWSWNDGFAIQRLAGPWKLQLLDEGVLVAEKSFSIETDYVTPKVPLLGAVATANGAGGVSLLAAPLQADATEKSAFWTLDQAFVANALAGGTISPSAGAHTLTVDVNSGNSRYDGSVGHGGTAQDDGPDNALRLNDVTNTAPTRAGFSANVSGTRAALTLDGQVQIAATGKQQIYLAILTGNSLLFQTPNGWSSSPQPLMEASGPGWAAMNILKREDVRNLPAGTSFYLGYGTSLDDLLAKATFGLAYTLP